MPLAQEPEEQRVFLVNPEKQELSLRRVGGGRLSLGIEQASNLRLELGRYVLESKDVSIPVPLFNLGAGAPMRLIIEPAPETPQGFVYIPSGPTPQK